MKCLLIETADKRKFFTTEKNLPHLVEFSKTFNAKISLVKIENGNLLELDELAQAICNQNEEKTKIVFEKIDTKSKSRSDILNLASKIQAHIINQCITKQTINLKDLKKQFNNLSTAAICNHIRRVKIDLEARGYKFKKIAAGFYQISPK